MAGSVDSVSVDANAAFVDLWCRHHAGAVTPCITYIGQHLGNLGVAQDLSIRGHAVGARIAGGGRRVTPIKNAADSVDGRIHGHGPVARQPWINAGGAFAGSAMAILAMFLVDSGALL